ADLYKDQDPHLEILVSSSNFDIQSTIFKYIDGTYRPIFNISADDPRNVGGAACAVGDIDKDGQLEFVVTEEFPDSDGICRVRLFDWIGETWVNVANYDFALGYPMNWIYQTQIIDADNDGVNEIFVNPEREPIQILEYIDGNLVCSWKAPVHSDSMCASIAGDINNDGLIDLIVSDPVLDIIYVFETQGIQIINTFNISVPGLVGAEDNGMAIGDIDGDGLNEFVYVSRADSYLRIFKDNELLFTRFIQTAKDSWGYEGAYAVAIGDYDNDYSP
ncbi:MAG: hypothetical protein ACFFCH_11720, partial [Promethearchaeota archaeon]